LKKKYNKIFYKENVDEIDFYIEEENLNIQVCYELNSENIQREIKPLLKQNWKKILVYFSKIGEFSFDLVEVIDFIEFIQH